MLEDTDWNLWVMKRIPPVSRGGERFAVYGWVRGISAFVSRNGRKGRYVRSSRYR
jgi:hypothetical protein